MNNECSRSGEHFYQLWYQDENGSGFIAVFIAHNVSLAQTMFYLPS